MLKRNELFAKSKKFLAKLLSFAVGVSAISTVGVSAEVINKGDNTGWEFVNDINQTQGVSPSLKYDSNGNLVYCIEMNKQTPSGQNYSDGDKLDDGAYRILKNGYPNVEVYPKGNLDDATYKKMNYFITQAALWCYITDQVDLANFQVRPLGAVGQANNDMKRRITDLLSKANDSEVQNISLKFSQNNLKARYDGTNFVTDYLKIDVKGSIKDASFSIVTSPKIEGIKYQLENGDIKSQIPMNKNFRIIIPSDTPVNSVEIRATGKIHGAVTKVYVSPDKSVQDVVRWTPLEVNADDLDQLKVSWETNGSVEISKTDENGIFLDGASFELRDKASNVIAKGETANGGKLTFSNIPMGTYDLVETKAPTGYINSNKTLTVTVKPEQITQVPVSNDKIKGFIKIKKVDADNNEKPIEGTEFTIYNSDNKAVATLTTDKNGEATTSELEYGNYTIKETKASEGYVINDKVEKVNITVNGKTEERTFEDNRIKTPVVFSKTDVSTGDLVKGAKIKITCIEGLNKGQTFEFTTSDNEEDNTFPLEYGTYTFEETQAPEGYVLSTEVGTFKISENGYDEKGNIITDKIVKANLENKRITGKVDFTKTDVSTGEIIEGAVIKIECIEGFDKGKVIEFVSSKDGNSFDLQYGKYKFYETQAPNGYDTTTEEGTFEITEDGQVIKANLKNAKTPIPVTTETPQTPKTPSKKTGDNVLAFGLSFLGCLGLAAGTIFMTKRKRI